VESFLKNCGVGSLDVSLRREGVGAPLFRCFQQPYFLIGRDARCDLTLDDPRVSRRHAYVQAVGGRVLVVDLDSREGVHWPSGPRASDWLAGDEPLRIGGASLQISPSCCDTVSRPFDNEGQAALVPKRTQMSRIESPVVFEVVGGATGVRRWSMSRPFALAGGANACKVRLRGADVSRFHCGLVKGPLGVWVVDLLSSGGTRINGQKTSCARLEDGDRLQVGSFVIRVWYEAPVEAGASPLLPAVRRVEPAANQSMLLPVINEFNLMQQQMMDQFHQSMLMMAEMFTTLHREQTGLVREEMEHLRRITQELTTLQGELARQKAGEPAAPAAPVPVILAENPESEPTTTVAVEPPAVSAPPAEPMKSPPDKAQGAASPAPAPADVHEWLNRRIVELQEERQGRWQKLLRFVRGEGG
jgi:pSer/pThr/pTyr-binding forkhead associated (FHA) protein